MLRAAKLLCGVTLAALFVTPAHADFEFTDLACETTATTGTGTVDLAGAISNYLGFIAAGIDTGDTVPYHIVSGDGKMETGIGTVTDGTPDTMTRVAQWSTDGSGAELSLSGTSNICIGPITAVWANADKGDITTSNGFQTWVVDADSVALGTDTTGNYVLDVADGTGIDGTAAGEGATYTPTFDATELTGTTTFGAGAAVVVAADLTATSGDVTSGDDVIVGDDVQIASTNAINFGAGDVIVTHASNVLNFDSPVTVGSGVAQQAFVRATGATNSPILQGNAVGSGAGTGSARYFNDAGLSSVMIAKSRGASVGSHAVVVTDDGVGELTYSASDGTDFEPVASISTYIDGSPGAGDMPGRMELMTTADAAEVSTTRVTIKNDGGVIIGPNDTSGGAKSLTIDDQGTLEFGEAEANGDSAVTFAAPAALGADRTCVFEDDANPIPDSCVGDGSDGGGSLADADYVDITVSSSGTAWNLDADVVTPTELAEAGDYDFTGTVTIDSDGLQIDDTNASHQLIITPGSDLAADRVFTITTGDAARTLTISANATLNDADYGDITTSSSFTSWNLDADVVTPSELAEAGDYDFTGTVTLDADALQIDDTNASHQLIITPGSDLAADRVLTLTTGDSARTITLSGNPTLSDWFDQSVKAAASPTFANPTVTTLELGAAATDATFARTGAGTATLEGKSIKTAGEQTIYLPAGAGTYPVAGGIAQCAPVAAFDSGSNDVFMRQCSFSATVDNALYFTIGFPKSADESVDLQVAVDWTSATTTDATDDVFWTAAVVCFSNDDAINGNAFPTVDTVVDTQTAAGDFMRTSRITAITPAGTWTEGDACVLKITRDGDEGTGNDDFNGTAELIGVSLYYQDNAANEN
jgi:hypothetical protein